MYSWSRPARHDLVARSWRCSTLLRDTTRSFLAARCSVADVAHHVLDARVVLEAVHRQVLAVARVLEPAVRHLRDEGDVGVDPDHAEVESPRHPHRAGVVLGPDAGGQA